MSDRKEEMKECSVYSWLVFLFYWHAEHLVLWTIIFKIIIKHHKEGKVYICRNNEMDQVLTATLPTSRLCSVDINGVTYVFIARLDFSCHNNATSFFNPLNPELNPTCYLLALLEAHHFLHVSRIRVKSLTFRLLMSYIYIYIYIWSTHSWCF